MAPGEQFTHFAPHALDAGVRNVLSLPVVLGGKTLGSLNLYSSTEFGPRADTIAEVVASQVAIVIARSDIQEAASRLAQSIQGRADDRTQIRIAEGILMGLHEVSREQAQNLLNGAADGNSEELLDVAKRIRDFLSVTADDIGSA
jgi:GAF domain-containing protein